MQGSKRLRLDDRTPQFPQSPLPMLPSLLQIQEIQPAGMVVGEMILRVYVQGDLAVSNGVLTMARMINDLIHKCPSLQLINPWISVTFQWKKVFWKMAATIAC